MVNTVSDIMSTDIVIASSSDSISNVAKKMKDYVIGFIPIVDNNILRGVVTDRDLVIRGYAEDKSGDKPIGEVMTSHCIVVDVNCSIEDVARTMSENKIRRLCVVDRDNLIGICAIGDLAVRPICECDASEALSDISRPSNQHAVRQ